MPFGHKVAVAPIKRGDRVIKYGQTIGFASQDINKGDWVHSHNLSAGVFDRDHAIGSEIPPTPLALPDYKFQGYRRGDDRCGTRNMAVISSVNCSASVAKFIADRFNDEWLADFPNIDGIIPLTHKGGCAIQVGGEEHQNLTRTLAGFAKHANVGGYLLVGLGCETAGCNTCCKKVRWQLVVQHHRC